MSTRPASATGTSRSTGSADVPADQLESMPAAELAARYGLTRMGVRPGLSSYLGALWSRRHFIRTLATSKAYARNQGNYLGQLWALLTPLINAGVYYVIFGLLLSADGGLPPGVYPAFLVIGVFLYRFSSSSLTAGARCMTKNLPLLRSLHFPRAVLPTATVLSELATLGPALVVMLGIVVATGQAPQWKWLLLMPLVLLHWLWNTGVGFIMARLGDRIPDLNNLLPFALRILMYASGVFFAVGHYAANLPWPWLSSVLEWQPLAVYLDLARSSLIEAAPATFGDPTIFDPDPAKWLAGAGWAMVFLIGGFLYFWRGEETYGRD
ncbi:MAG: ABC transporter permease [Angustibacter sp.]